MVVCLICERGFDSFIELLDVVGDEVGQVGVLGVALHRLDRVELRAVGGQRLELDVLPAELGDPLLRRAVNAPAVPHDDQRPADLLPQPTQEVDRVVGLHVVALHVEAAADSGSCRRQGDRADDTQPITSVPRPLHGCLAPRGPGAAIHRLEHEARFVEEDDTGPSPAGFF